MARRRGPRLRRSGRKTCCKTQPEIARGARLAVINQTTARQYWPDGDVLGKQLRLPDLKGEPPFSQAAPDSNSWLQIIGIVADARDDGLRKPNSMPGSPGLIGQP